MCYLLTEKKAYAKTIQYIRDGRLVKVRPDKPLRQRPFQPRPGVRLPDGVPSNPGPVPEPGLDSFELDLSFLDEFMTIVSDPDVTDAMAVELLVAEVGSALGHLEALDSMQEAEAFGRPFRLA